MKSRSRLVAPTILSILLCLVLFDYLSYKQSGWSVLAVLWKVLAVLAVVFTPSPETIAGLFSDVDRLLSFSFVLIAFATIWVMVSVAKRSMRIATPDPNDHRHAIAAAVRRDEKTAINKADGSETAQQQQTSWRARGIVRFAFIATAFCLATWLVVDQARERWYEHEIAVRGQIASENLAQLLTLLDGKNNQKMLAAALERFSAQPAVAYYFVVEKSGKILLESQAELMTQRKADAARLEPTPDGSHMLFRGEAVFESGRSLGDAGDRSLHVGIRKDAIISEREPLTPMVTFIAVAALMALAIFSAIWLFFSYRLRRLVAGAARISAGEMDFKIDKKDHDELGDVAQSIERMRSSLMAVNHRLGGDPAADPDPDDAGESVFR